MRKVIIASLFLFTVALLERQAWAQGTLYPGTPYLISISRGGAGAISIYQGNFIAQGFITGTNADGYLLNAIEFDMYQPGGDANNLNVSLYGFDANSNSPGSILATLASQPIYAYPYVYGGSDIILQPNTIYFVGLTTQEPSISSYRWGVANSDAQSLDGWAFYGRYFHDFNSGQGGLNTGVYQEMVVYATAVPEPAAGVLFGLGLAGLGLWRRQRK